MVTPLPLAIFDRRGHLREFPHPATIDPSLTRGVSVTTMVALVTSGHASTTVDRVRAGAPQIEVATLVITDAGRRAIDFGAPQVGPPRDARSHA